MVAVSAMAHEMSFIEHLEELRRRILWSAVAVAVAFAVCWIFSGDLYDLASGPIRANDAVTLSLSRPQDIFSLHMKVTLVAAIFVASPIVLLQAWLFISPGLYPHERRYAIPFVLSASMLFVAGGAFGYYVITPTTDVANMLLIAGPMVLLYCLGIGVACAVGKPRKEN